uniref:REPA_OB_2 domain-containing protein n=1 Tax=Strongyloides papillosus TaxID=174720 RepID=A0A0N5BB63_STREA
MQLVQNYSLSTGFFGRLEEERIESIQPVLQVLKDVIIDEISPVKLHLNDGSSIYTLVTIRGRALEKFIMNEMKNCKSVVKLLKFHRRKIWCGEVSKIHIVVDDFTLLVKDYGVIGNPKLYCDDEERGRNGGSSTDGSPCSPPIKMMRIVSQQRRNNMKLRVAPQQQGSNMRLELNRCLLEDIEEYVKECIDVVAILHRMTSPEPKQTSGKGEQNMMKLILLDESNTEVQLVAWGSRCNQFTPDMRHKPIVLKSIGVKEWSGGYELTFRQVTKVIKGEELKITEDLSKWYAARQSGDSAGGGVVSIQDIYDGYSTNRISGNSYYNITGKIVGLVSNSLYKTCNAREGCCSKVEEVRKNVYECRKCGEMSSFRVAPVLVFLVRDDSTIKKQKLHVCDFLAESLLQRKRGKILKVMDQYSSNSEDVKQAVAEGLVGRTFWFRVKIDAGGHGRWIVKKYRLLD